MALERVSTTLTKGWFREFAASHYPLVKDLDVNLASHYDYIMSHPDAFKYVDNLEQPEQEAEGEDEMEFEVSETETVVDDFFIDDELEGKLKQIHIRPDRLPERTRVLLARLLKFSTKARPKHTWNLRIQPRSKTGLFTLRN